MLFRPKLASRRTAAFFLNLPTAVRYRRELRRGSLTAVHDTGVEADLAIVVCLWRRSDRLIPILRMLETQAGSPRLRVVFWNNDASQSPMYLQALRAHSLTGAVVRVDFVSATHNIGGAARFVVATRLAREGGVSRLVMLDDDQDVAPDFIERLIGSWRPRTYAGVWAWRIHGDYWDRTEAEPEGSASYLGTGGSICDVELLASPRVARRLPVAFHFLEDIWLSACAHRAGYDVLRADAEFTFTDDHGGQWHALARAKSDFYDVLRRPDLVPRP